ncbi:MAG: M56 family metallopeptidase [Actinomycetota bacterium]
MTTISQLLLTFLLNACWQIALVTAIAAICARLLRGASARYKHLLWVAAFFLSFGLPIFTCSALLRDSFFPKQPVPQTADNQTIVRQANLPLEIPPDLSETNAKASLFLIPIERSFALVLLIAYLLFVLYRGAKLLRAWQRTKVIAESAYQTAFSDDIQTAIEKCQTVVGIEKASVLFSASIPVPITMGNRRPLIILPEQLLKETDVNVLTSAIGHELVHVRRRDYLFNIIYEFIFLPLSFHPAATLVKRRINQTRELCCDEIVAERLLKAEVYARSLVKLAGSASNLSRLAPTTTLGIMDAENLEIRIMSLLKKSELNLHKKSLLIISGLLLIVVPCMMAAIFTFRIGINNVSAQQNENPTLTQHREEEERIVKLKKEIEERRINGGDTRELEDRLKRALEEHQNQDGGKIDARKPDEEKMIGPTLAKEEKEERLEQAQFAKEAKISMEQAIQIATNSQPGAVIESKLARTPNEVVYVILILDKDAAEEGNSTKIIISALDGQVITINRISIK